MVDKPASVGRFVQLHDEDLPPEKVLVEISYSSLNYKDGLAVTGRGKIVRKFPMVCGIDLAGKVIESADPRFQPGDEVAALGLGLSEQMWGGFSGRMRVSPEILFKVPSQFDAKDTMAVGTAGFTAMIAVMMLEAQGLTSDKGEVLVTGAGGGVGSIAVSIFAGLGYRVVASTGRMDLHDYLKSLGAKEVIARSELDHLPKPLESGRWAGALDSVGSRTLANILASTKELGCVGTCGLAGGADLPTNVMPFILRGVRLIGVNCFLQAKDAPAKAWARLATEFSAEKRRLITKVEPLSKIVALSDAILQGQVRGRVVIDVTQ